MFLLLFFISHNEVPVITNLPNESLNLLLLDLATKAMATAWLLYPNPNQSNLNWA